MTIRSCGRRVRRGMHSVPDPGGSQAIQMRVAVIGLGGVGSMAARALARRGCRVTGFEQFRLDHALGSSYGGSRIIRRVYPDALYAGLMAAAYPLWEELEAESGEELFLRCGGFFFGPELHPEMLAIETALRAVGHPYDRWDAKEAMSRLPAFRLSAEEVGIWDRESGLLRASRCVLAAASVARRLGAELCEGVAVQAVEPTPTGVRVRAAGEWLPFDAAVVCAGSWAGRILAATGVDLPLRPTRQQYAHFQVEEPRTVFSPSEFPVWIDFASHHYGFPEHDPIPGAKVALHQPGPDQDPDHLDRSPDPAETARLREYMRGRLPGASGEPTHEQVCLYTMTPDSDFVVGALPDAPQVVYFAGLSGHGFKFAVLLGEIAARLALGEDPGHDLGRFSPDRFSDRNGPARPPLGPVS